MAVAPEVVHEIALRTAQACAAGQASPIERLPRDLYFTVPVEGDEVVVADRNGAGFELREQIERMAGAALREVADPVLQPLKRLAWSEAEARAVLARLNAGTLTPRTRPCSDRPAVRPTKASKEPR